MKEPKSKLHEFLLEKFGSITTAASYLDIPYQTLYTNCKRPTWGWKHIDRLLSIVMEERDEAKAKLEDVRGQYNRLAQMYNSLVDKYEQEEERI